MPLPFRLALLGHCALEGPEGPIDLSSKKLLALLAYLAHSGSRPQARERLMTLLWGTHSDVQARQNLRQALHRLRATLGKAAIVSRGDQISIAPEVLACDIADFEALAKEGSRRALASAVALYKGPFLADLSIPEPDWEEWSTIERQRLEHHALQAMVDLAALELDAGNAQAALAAAERAVAINPLREDAHRMILRALANAGRKAEALARYAQLKDILQRELGVEPDTTTHALATELRAAEARAASPQHRAPATPPPPVARAIAPADAATAPSGQEDIPLLVPRHAPAVRRLDRPLARVAWVGAALVMLAGVALAAIATWSEKPSGPRWTSDVPHRRNEFRVPIAVLPFRAAAASDHAAQDFADSVGDEITNYLSRFSILSVPPRELIRQGSGVDDQLSFWSKAGLHYAVSGSVWTLNGSQRLSVQLIDVGSRLQVWSRNFEYSVAEWAVQREVVLRKVASLINLEAVRREASRPYAMPEKPSVAELIGRGWKGLVSSPDTVEFAQAESHFTRALERDPDSVSATVGLAAFKLIVTTNHIGDREQFMREAETLLQKVLAKDVDTHSLRYNLGVLYNLRNESAAALREFERAVELNPSMVAAHAHKGRVLLKLGRYEEALECVRYAKRLTEGKGPSGWALWQAIALLELGQDEAAGDAFLEAFQAQPLNPYLVAGVAAFSALTGDWETVRRHVVTLRALTPGRTDTWRLWELNKGPGDQPLPNRFGKGLQLALETLPEIEASAMRKASSAAPAQP
jgi:DNA-binding SARP family transcriptional activator/TolB-like protein/Flp pilus assembly protein TadD